MYNEDEFYPSDKDSKEATPPRFKDLLSGRKHRFLK
jgi:hypothetical protein